MEQYHFLKQDYDALSQQLIEKDEVIQKLQESKEELKLEVSHLQKFEMETVDVKVIQVDIGGHPPIPFGPTPSFLSVF